MIIIFYLKELNRFKSSTK